MSVKELLKILLLSLLLLGLTACGPLIKGADSKRSVHVLAPDFEAGEVAVNPERGRLVIGAVQSGGLSGSGRIVFRKRDGSLGYYQHSVWNQAPTARLRSLMVQHFETGGLFGSVGSSAAFASADYALNCELLDFYHDLGDKPGSAVVRLRAELLNISHRESMGTQIFSFKQEAESYDAEGAVEAFDVATLQLLNATSEWVEEVLDAQIPQEP